MPNIAKACERMRYWCEDGNLGYDQSNRWDIRPGGETDCSALVIHVLREAGFDTGDASYTGDMSYNLTRRGWKRLPADLSTARPGDILLNDSHHVALVIGGQASIDEHGRASGGASGDQTGRETNTRPIYEYSRGWDCILRYDGPLDVNMKRKERAMEFLIQPDGQPRMDYVCGDAIHPLHHPDEMTAIQQVYRKCYGEDIPCFAYGSPEAPWATRWGGHDGRKRHLRNRRRARACGASRPRARRNRRHLLQRGAVRLSLQA